MMPLIPLAAEHLELILPWRNAPAVRWAMYHQHEISLEEHLAWFERLNGDNTKQWYLFQDEAGDLQGVVYFTDINQEQQTAFWGFYARAGAPMGTGLQMAFSALEHAFYSLKLHKLCGEVLSSNIFIVNLNKMFGFKQEGVFREQHLAASQRVDIIRFGMLSSEWPAHREKLEKRVSVFYAN